MKQIHLVKQLNGTFIPAYDSDKELMSREIKNENDEV